MLDVSAISRKLNVLYNLMTRFTDDDNHLDLEKLRMYSKLYTHNKL